MGRFIMPISNHARIRSRRRAGNSSRGLRPRLESLESRDVPSWSPVGPEFRANTTTVGDQGLVSNRHSTSVALDSDGDFVICWRGQGSTGDALYAQRYDLLGNPVGTEFRLNSVGTFLTVPPYKPVVAMSAGGTFVVAWQGSTAQNGSPDLLYARRFNDSGVPLGNEILVGSGGPFDFCRIACDAIGNFVVVYAAPDAFNYGIFARRFNASGAPLGAAFPVNETTATDETFLDVAMNESGQFVVTWLSIGSAYAVYARRYDAAGLALSSEFPVDSVIAPPSLGQPALGIDETGAFVVAWADGTYNGTRDISARRYGSDGTPMGGKFRVNTYVTDSQTEPTAVMDVVGRFTVAWWSRGQDGDGWGVYAQCYNAEAVPQGSEFRVNTHTTSHQHSQSMAISNDGKAVVAWSSLGQDGSGYGVYAQRYAETAPAPAVDSVRVNDGSVQRSRVADLTVTFNKVVTLGGGKPSTAFTLVGPSGPITLAVDLSQSTATQTIAKLTFTGPTIQAGSLADGRYTLTVLAAQVTDSFGQHPATNYTFGDAQGLFRFFGDINGDRRVDIADYGLFSLSYLNAANYVPAFDFNGDGRVDIADYGQFSLRYLMPLP